MVEAESFKIMNCRRQRKENSPIPLPTREKIGRRTSLLLIGMSLGVGAPMPVKREGSQPSCCNNLQIEQEQERSLLWVELYPQGLKSAPLSLSLRFSEETDAFTYYG